MSTSDQDDGGRTGAVPARLALGGALVVIVSAVLYALIPQLVELTEEAPRLAMIRWAWIPVMAALWVAGLLAIWTLLHAALPRVKWLDLATVHLSANAVANVVPGGTVTGGATMVRLLHRTGVDATQAAAAILATGIIAAASLTALAPLATAAAAVTATVPARFEVIALFGAGIAAVLVVTGVVLLRTRFPMRVLVRAAGLADRVILHRLGYPLQLDLEAVLTRRRQLREVLADRWWLGVSAAVAHWLFEMATLAVALIAAGATVSPTVLTVAYVAAAVLRLVPITPGGLGLVETGLVGTLVIADVAFSQAVLGVFLYRIATYWLALPLGLAAYLVLRRRHAVPGPAPTSTASTADDDGHRQGRS